MLEGTNSGLFLLSYQLGDIVLLHRATPFLFLVRNVEIFSVSAHQYAIIKIAE